MATATMVMNTARVIVVIDPGLQVRLELDSYLQPNALGRWGEAQRGWRGPESPDKEET